MKARIFRLGVHMDNELLNRGLRLNLIAVVHPRFISFPFSHVNIENLFLDFLTKVIS